MLAASAWMVCSTAWLNVKIIPLQARTSPEVSRRLRPPDFQNISA